VKLTTWLIGVPLALSALAFSIANRQTVALDLWPMPYTAEVKLFLLVLAPFVLGFLLGGMVSWTFGGSVRAKLRRSERAVLNLEREMNILHSQVAPPESSADKPASSPTLIAAA